MMTSSHVPRLLSGRRALDCRPKLVAIDVDHTLIRSDHTLADATVDAVRTAWNAGVRVTLASSRPPGGLWHYLKALGLIAPASFVGCQGALVGSYDPSGKLAVHAAHAIDVTDALAAVAAARSVSMVTNWYTADRWFVDSITNAVEREAGIVRMTPVFVTDLKELQPPVKLLFIAERSGQIEKLVPLLPSSVTTETSNPAYLEITARGVDKATGVGAVAAQLGIDFSEVVAIGDGRNDLGLLRCARTSIAMANAVPEVLSEADYVTQSNDDDGVAIALRWLSELPQ